MKILITGAGGYIGRQLAERLSQRYEVVGVDLRADESASFPLLAMDIRDPALSSMLVHKQISHVVHLAAVLEDSGNRERDFDIDVNGTRNVLTACVNAGVRHIVVSSSGAAYGYHADNPQWLSETDALRGNKEFAYSDHKRQVEEMLEAYRRDHPQLQQLILRVGTVLGANTKNLITNLFKRKRLLSVKGSAAPFVFIWDKDLLSIIEQGVVNSTSGIFNVAGDGTLTMEEIAALINKPVLRLSARVLKSFLAIGKLVGLTRYGPSQINFLRYRPVLSNKKLKSEFSFTPEKTSEEAFLYFARHARSRGEL
ncbi:MAG: SDR family oxidoreductase [Alcanivoracaceae bacterium]|nr:SDR family oxidoreductase [Alcanivoracaceae bacterium]